MSWIFSKAFSIFTSASSENSEDKMSSLVLKRLQKELELVRKQNENVEVVSVSEDFTQWEVTFRGRYSSNYEGVKTELFF